MRKTQLEKMNTVGNMKMRARALCGRQCCVFKELKYTSVAGVREASENVSIKLDKVYNSVL